MAFFEAFGVDIWKLGFQIINFLLLMYLLNRFLFKRVIRLLDERQTRISQGLEDAESAARDRELARAGGRAREESAAEKDRALAEIRGEVADLALEAAGKLVGSEMDAPTQRRLV